MVVKSLGLAAIALIAATSLASAAVWHGKHRTRIVIHPRIVGTQAGWLRGADTYPAHIVPLAAYPSPGGIGITFQPFGWGGWRASY